MTQEENFSAQSPLQISEILQQIDLLVAKLESKRTASGENFALSPDQQEKINATIQQLQQLMPVAGKLDLENINEGNLMSKIIMEHDKTSTKKSV